MFVKKIFWTSQFLCFGLIGAANTIVHGLILTIIIECFFLNVIISNGVAFLMANVFSYFMNSFFTFKIPITFFSYLKFLSASTLSLGLTLFIAWGMDYLGFHYLVGFLVIIFFVPALSFVVMKFWAFNAVLSKKYIRSDSYVDKN